MPNGRRYLELDWPAPQRVKACFTTRINGYSQAPYQGFNLAHHVGDTHKAVEQNRQTLIQDLKLHQPPLWLFQVHGTQVIQYPDTTLEQPPEADAIMAKRSHQVCAIMTADCLPVLFCHQAGTQVAAAHAGWRGLCNGILERTVKTFAEPQWVMAYLGPAISADAFEVGVEVRDAFINHDPSSAIAFKAHGTKFLADLYVLAKLRLQAAGVTQIYGVPQCTYHQKDMFFSYRRDKKTGRQASLIWLT